jgi:hypothetical protein
MKREKNKGINKSGLKMKVKICRTFQQRVNESTDFGAEGVNNIGNPRIM